MADAPVLEAEEEAGWREGARGQYVTARDRQGIIWRQGEETIEEAYARDAKRAAEKDAPKKKAGKRKPPAPAALDLKALEVEIEKALVMPGAMAGLLGDPWPAFHVEQTAPALARNLVACAEVNPWFREKLILVLGGPGMFGNAMLFAALAGSAFSYLVPLIVHYVNPPLPAPALAVIRGRYQIPERPTIDDLEAMDLAGYSPPAEDPFPGQAPQNQPA